MALWFFVLGMAIGIGLCIYFWSVPDDYERTRRKLAGRDLYAQWVLDNLNSSFHRMSNNRKYYRLITLRMMPDLLSDVRERTRLSQPLSVAALLLSYAVYGLTWIKTQVRAGRDDLRGLIGVQVLFVKILRW